MKIGFYIGALLYRHDCVVIPGFGGFIAHNTSAYIHPVQNTFIPPSRQIMFNASLLHNDGLLATYIAREEGIGFEQALHRIAQEVVAIHAELNSGKVVVFDGFGSVRTNHEHNIVFTPKLTNNYLEEAYGLPTFVSPAIRRTGFQSNQENTSKSTGIHLPSTVRRIAAIAVPLIAIGMWSLFNTDKISNFTSSYSSVFPSQILSSFSVSSIKKSIPFYVLSHAKASELKTPYQKADTKEIPSTVIVPDTKTGSGITEEKTISKISGSHPTLSENTANETGHFLIISGAFRQKGNAEKFLIGLKAQNFDATLAGQNRKGLYLVSAASCDDADQATLKLKEVRDKGIEAAWILNN